MWLSFAIAVAAAVLVIYVPGMLVIRLFRHSWWYCLICSPIFSALGYSLICIAYVALGVKCSWYSVMVPYFVVSAVLVACFELISRKRRNVPIAQRRHWWQSLDGSTFDARWLAAYLGVAVCVAFAYFVLPLDGPASVYQENDCYAHLNTIRDFVESGSYYDLSSLTYPQAWYDLVVLVLSLTRVDIGIALNAVNFVLIALVFPSGFYLLMSRFFPDRPKVVHWGSLMVLAFAPFPWGLLYFGPLYPNMSAYSLLPLAMVLFADMLSFGLGRRQRVGRIALFISGCVALAILHPNAIFAAIALMSPYCVHLIWSTSRKGARFDIRSRAMCSLGFSLFILVVWVGLFVAPPLQGVVWFDWDPYLTIGDSVLSVLLLDLTKATVPQYAMAIVVLVGLAYCVISRKHLWLVASYAIQVAIFIGSSALDGLPRHFLSGFWYSDTFRVAAMMVFVLIPLASLGLAVIASAVQRLLHRLIRSKNSTLAPVFLSAALICLIVYLNFASYLAIPGVGPVYNGFGQVGYMMRNGNNLQEDYLPYDGSERRFVEQVKEVVPESETVINMPHDGSTYAYGLDGLHTLYQGWYGYRITAHPDDLELIRMKLNEYMTDPSVKDALRALGLRYVLVLDKDSVNFEGLYMGGYDENAWKGITSIDDSTPGFKIILEEGDKRLYELTGV